MPTVNGGHTTLAESSNTSSHAVPVPTNSVGDAVYIAIVCDGSQTFTFPAGFAKLISDTVTNGTATLAVARKVVSGSPDSGTYTVTTSGSERAAAVCWSQSGDNGVDGTTPTPNTGDSATATCPSMTTTVGNALVLRIVGTDGQSSTHSTLSGYTKIAEVEQFSAGTISVQYIIQASAGSTGTADVTITSEQWAAATVAIAGTGGTTYEDAVTLARSATVTSVAAAVVEGAVALGRSETAVAAAANVIGDGATLGRAVGVAADGGILSDEAVALARSGGVGADSGLGFDEALALARAGGVAAGSDAVWETAVSLAAQFDAAVTTDFVNPIVIPSVALGYNARILIADPWRVVIAETQAAMEPVSWMINDYGTSAMTMARTDRLFSEMYLQYGNWVYVEFDNGLPPWAGYINKRDGDGRRFTAAGVTVPLVSAEHYLSRLVTGKNRQFVNATAGNIVESVIGEANAAYGEGIVIGEMWGGGGLHTADYHFNSLWEVIVEDVVGQRVDAEFWIVPRLAQGRIELTANFKRRRGERRGNVALIQGHNMTEEEFEEPGELVNQWALAGDDIGGDGNGWGNSRLDELAAGVDAVSMGQYGIWGRGEVLGGVRTQGELAQIARERVAKSAGVVEMVCCSAVNLAPARFGDYQVGDSVRAMAATATFGGFDKMVRVLGREFDFADGVCQLMLGRDFDV